MGHGLSGRQTPSEVEALFRDLLIGVTGFFRDPDDNIIESAVISFINITERKQAEDAIQKALDEIDTLRS
jgi:chemotaxis methyl-accepting protein methylase